MPIRNQSRKNQKPRQKKKPEATTEVVRPKKAPRKMSRLSRQLTQAGLGLKKGLGQNFLVNQGVLEKIAVSALATEKTHLIEIGCGLGNLSELLAREAGSVISVELDERFRHIHKRELGAIKNLGFVYGDFLELPLAGLIPQGRDSDVRVIGNIPYHLTSPILFKLVVASQDIQAICLLMQREVAVRLAARKTSSHYGILAAKMAVRFDVQSLFNVSPGSFMPPPKVVSTLVRLTPRKSGPMLTDREEVQYFFNFIDACFAQRRKMLCKSLSANSHGLLERETIQAALENLNQDTAIRAEALSPEDLLTLFHALKNPEIASLRRVYKG